MQVEFLQQTPGGVEGGPAELASALPPYMPARRPVALISQPGREWRHFPGSRSGSPQHSHGHDGAYCSTHILMQLGKLDYKVICGDGGEGEGYLTSGNSAASWE